MRRLMDAGVPFRVEHHLCQAGSIPQVDEDQAPVIATPLHPSHQTHGLADSGCAELPARMRARHHDASFSPPAAASFSRWISGSVRNRYSPAGSVPSVSGPNLIRLSFNTGWATASSIRFT